MSKFRKLSNSVWASPQISVTDIEEASRLGIALIINNRPEGEAPDQTPGAAIEEAARAVGVAYRAIPVASLHGAQIADMVEALQSAGGPVLAYCTSGMRSAFLWALAMARLGEDPEHIAQAALAAGYDVSPVRPAMDRLAVQNRS